MVDTPIGSNSPNYTLVAGDVGATIFCRVTATNASGSAQAFSNTVGPVSAAGVSPPVNSVVPSIGPATTTQGTTYSVTSHGTWSGSPTFTRQWKSDAANVGDGSTSYTSVAGDVGKTITCVVTATNAGGSANATSNSVGPVTAAAATTTFDPANKTAAITLSGGNLTATNTAAARGGCRSVASASSGKKYFEVLITAAGTPAANVIGFGNASLAFGSYPGSSNDGAGMAMDGTVYVGNNIVLNNAAVNVGDRVCVAIDFTPTPPKIWFRTNGGAWNTGLGSADPVTGTNSANLAGINAGPYYAFVSQFSNADACTANFGGSAYAHTPPSGYGNV